MNSFINAGSQGKLRNFLENSLSGSWVSGPTFRVPGPTYEMGPGSRVLLFGNANYLISLQSFQIAATITAAVNQRYFKQLYTLL